MSPHDAPPADAASSAPAAPEKDLAPPPVDGTFPTSFGPVFSWGLRRVVRWRKVALVGGLGVALGLVIGLEAISPLDPIRTLVQVFDEGVLTLALPLIALLLASEGFSYEIQERTLVYHLVRPVSRTTFFLARYLAGVVPAALVAVVFMGTVVASSGVGPPLAVWLALPVVAGFGLLALSAVYYTLAALLKNGLIAGLVYTFVVETMITSVPGSMQKLSVMFHVRSLFHRLTDGSWTAMSEGGGVGPAFASSPDEFLLGGAAKVPWDTTAEAMLVLGIITAGALLVGVLRVRGRDYALKD